MNVTNVATHQPLSLSLSLSLSVHIHSDACCYECASSNLETIAATFRDTSLVANRTLLLGSADGSLLVQPPDTPSANCDKLGMDARLQTWFTSTTRVNPLEVVIVLDLFQNRFIGNEDFYKDLRFAVSVILNSLTNRDRVSVTTNYSCM